MANYLNYGTLAAAIILAAHLRLNNLDWDQGLLTHPDETFVAMVSSKVRLPHSLYLYLHTALSPFNPATHGFNFYVYGTLPLAAIRTAADAANLIGLQQLTMAGRWISSLLDIFSVLLIYLIGRTLYGIKTGLLAALLLAGTVLHIQHAHYSVFESWLVFFTLATALSAANYAVNPKWPFALLTGLFFGLAVSVKISALHLAPALLIGWMLGLRTNVSRGEGARRCITPILQLSGALATTVAAIRLAYPYAFVGGSLATPNPLLVKSLSSLARAATPNPDYPPSVQWHGRHFGFLIENLFFWGLGPALGTAVIAGVFYSLYELIFRRRLIHAIPLAACLPLILYLSGSTVKPMRYALPALPFLCLAASYLCAKTLRQRNIRIALLVFLPLFTLHFAWAFGFAAIYSRPFTRYQARQWIVVNAPAGATLLQEEWDQRLFFSRAKNEPAFRYEALQIFTPDKPEKAGLLSAALTKADFIVLNSQRGYGSIPRWHERYPLSSGYYKALFEERLGFKLEKIFTSFPTLLGIERCTFSADESFSVYDHPPVLIFKKTESLSMEQYAEEIRKATIENSGQLAIFQEITCNH
ncbi:MAG: glycosyltransferase family 39 protein [Deltaproteobacteria bacterium]|nr:glycosyltransferase family 39 protein [Deltaproteobacteria bacterium]